jgi:hypothetical protein
VACVCDLLLLCILVSLAFNLTFRRIVCCRLCEKHQLHVARYHGVAPYQHKLHVRVLIKTCLPDADKTADKGNMDKLLKIP